MTTTPEPVYIFTKAQLQSYYAEAYKQGQKDVYGTE